jgi:hypothetical protein
MRSYEPWGRFQVPYERESILNGINTEITHHIGQTVDWWIYDPTTTAVDNIYDTGSVAAGKHWEAPFTLPCVNASLYQGITVQSDRGFYNTDLLRLTLNALDVERYFPSFSYNSDHHLKDRVVFRGTVFRPKQIYLKGQITDEYTIFSVDLLQINPEELINDQQFTAYSN